MNKEVYYEGWLIKSPPTKRIWRARWRRRWFTLKQGEIPEQFCLEYYADRKCRKLKGVIDLDQCEQVDCGLRLENRKQKFQFMFDIKTPKRTYYLAADTEQDMRDWVNCICQVCHLHDTKQQQSEENRIQETTTNISTNSSNDTTTTTLNTSAISTSGGGSGGGGGVGGCAFGIAHQNNLCDVLRKSATIIDQQPFLCGGGSTGDNIVAAASIHNNNDSAYINTEYTNRATLVCDAKFEQQHQQQRPTCQSTVIATTSSTPAVYLNATVFQKQQQQQEQKQQQQDSSRLAINANGVVRKIPENLVLNNASLATIEQQQSSSSVQPSPALSTASGPYIPISECFSGSPKLMLESNNPTTPLNNLDPKFYDTPRSHNNIGLNLTNDQSYSPKITNYGTQQPVTVIKNRNQQRSDSDSESVFTDDDEWTHPLPLREHLDRNTRPSDSSVENESFVLTYSQRFSKLPEDFAITRDNKDILGDSGQEPEQTDNTETLNKVLKNRNNLILDIKTKEKDYENEKVVKDLPHLSDTENTSPAFIGPKDAKSVVEESYDIPRSHQLPYYNMSQLLENKMTSPSKDNNPVAASTPNLSNDFVTQMFFKTSPIELESKETTLNSICGATGVQTLPRAHCYTNAAPTKIEGNVFRYDFMEHPSHVPPVNRKLKPKTSFESDKAPSDNMCDLPLKSAVQNNVQTDHVNFKVQSAQPHCNCINGQIDSTPLKPPSVDRKSKPNAFKIGQSYTLARRSTGAYSSAISNHDTNRSYALETHTLPRQPKQNYALSTGGEVTATPQSSGMTKSTTLGTSNFIVQHQRTASANAVIQLPTTTVATATTTIATSATAAATGSTAATALTTPLTTISHSYNQIQCQSHNLKMTMNQLQLQLPPKNEHKLQYFDLDVANAPSINRQSLSTSNLNVSGISNRLTLNADTSARLPMQSGVVYNSVDFVKTEAFKRIREERTKENEGVTNNTK